MKSKNKLLIFSFLSLSLLPLSACSVAGIKIIEKADNVQVSKENIEQSENHEDENVRTFKHAGYVFKEVDKTLYTTESAPAMDSLEENGSIVRSLVPGESVHVIGIDSGKKYAVCKDGENYLYVSMDSLTTKKPSSDKPKEREIIDKEELDVAIKESKEVLKDQELYTEDSVTKLRKKLVSAEKVFQDTESNQEDVDSALNSLLKAKKSLVEAEEPEATENEDKDENEEETEVETEVIQEKVKEYENVLTENREEYTEESLKAYDEAMDKMKELLKKDKVSASEVKKITMELDRAIAGLKLKKETDNKASSQEGLGVPYPSAPDSVDIYGGVTFAILKNVTATVSTDGKVYELSSAESKEIGTVKSGEKVKVLAIGTNDFARIEFSKGKVGFIKSTYLKQN